jgi:MFS family permease
VLGGLGEPIRKEFHLSDTQLGAITTLFTVLYAVVGLPLGRLADSSSRKKLLAAGIFVWSALTAASAFAASYTLLLLTRLGVGVGEAVCAPVSASWIGDLFPPQKRSRALAFFMLGVPLGGGLSYLISGPVAQAYGWRMALVVAALPALVLIPALLRMPEPRRGMVEGGAHAGAGWGVLLRIPTLGWIIASGALLNFNLYALATFLPAFLTRFHHLSVAKSGWWTGVGSIAAGLLFASASGLLGDRVMRWRKDGRMLAASAAMAAAAPIALLGILQPEGAWVASVVLISAAYGCLNMYYGLVYAAIQDIVAPTLRGTTMALYFMAMYLCGASFGPVITGRLSDAMARRSAGSEILTEAAKAIGLRQAMFVVPALALALALVLYAGSRTIARDMARRDELLTIPAAEAL